jgi:hypothetical protein
MQARDLFGSCTTSQLSFKKKQNRKKQKNKKKTFINELFYSVNIGFWKPTPNVTQYLALGLEVGSRLKKATPQEVSLKTLSQLILKKKL